MRLHSAGNLGPARLRSWRGHRSAARLAEESTIALTEERAAPPYIAVAEIDRSADKRRDQSAAALRLKGKIETSDYDVFLCYNSKDREHVIEIGERLKGRGILPWLDIWAIPPGTRWQKELQKQLKSIKSAAIFISPGGPGPWQELEVESLLGQIVKRDPSTHPGHPARPDR